MHSVVLITMFVVFSIATAFSYLPPEVVKHPSRELAVVTNNSLPKISVFPPYYRRKEYINKPFILECEAIGDPMPKYRWTKNGYPFHHKIMNGRVNKLNDTGTLIFSDPNEDDGGTYQCFAENYLGTATSDAALVFIVWSDPIRDTIYSKVAIENFPHKIPCKIPNGWPKWEVYWTKGTKLIKDERITVDPEGNLLFAYITLEDGMSTGYYRCIGKTAYISTPIVSEQLLIEEYHNNVFLNLYNHNMLKENNMTFNFSHQNQISPLEAQYISKPRIEIVSGQPAALYCIYGGNPIPTVSWSMNGKLLFLPDENIMFGDNYFRSLKIKHVQPSDQMNYTCHVSYDDLEEIFNHTISLIVKEMPKFIKEPYSMNISEGETATIEYSVSGTPNLIVTWYKNGDYIWANQDLSLEIRKRRDVKNYRLDITESALKIYDISDQDTGNYACNVSNEVGYVFKDVYINVIKAKPKSLIIPVAATLVLAGIIFISFGSFWVSKKKRKRKKPMVETSICLNTSPLPEQDPWQFNRARILLLDIIGEGNFGRVYLGEAIFAADIGVETKHSVAIKTTHVNAPDFARVDLLNELNIMKHIGEHLNVVKLIGACSETSPTLLIMELMSESLHQFLKKARAKKYYELPVGDTLRVTSQLLVGFALQIAKGMQHVSSQGIIHRDLAARNVLLSSELVCKISDFGLSRKVNDEELYIRESNVPLPIRWMSPESLSSKETSVKSDVWSFGVLMWEIVALGATPYPGKGSDEVKQMVCRGEFMEKPKTCEPDLYEIMKQCWQLDPKQRLDFKTCIDMLSDLLEKDAEYIQLNDFSEEEYLVVDNCDGEKV